MSIYVFQAHLGALDVVSSKPGSGSEDTTPVAKQSSTNKFKIKSCVGYNLWESHGKTADVKDEGGVKKQSVQIK